LVVELTWTFIVTITVGLSSANKGAASSISAIKKYIPIRIAQYYTPPRSKTPWRRQRRRGFDLFHAQFVVLLVGSLRPRLGKAGRRDSRQADERRDKNTFE
jgi:hypothetical protein